MTDTMTDMIDTMTDTIRACEEDIIAALCLAAQDNTRVVVEDHGIGVYEYWGSREVHTDIRAEVEVVGEIITEVEFELDLGDDHPFTEGWEATDADLREGDWGVSFNFTAYSAGKYGEHEAEEEFTASCVGLRVKAVDEGVITFAGIWRV